MKYKTDAYRADEARAIAAVHMIARIVGWLFKPEPGLIPIRNDPCFYEPNSYLLVLPAVDGWPAGIATAQRDLRVSALLISIGSTMTGEPTLYAGLRLCAGGKIVDHGCLRFWRGSSGGLWLLTDPEEREPEPVCFRITSTGPVMDAPPWRNDADLQAGLASAGALVS
ncbi:hypothetical protein M2333_001609 [Sphingobium sp. B11D3B]|uniref:hypothetical protein n=1 Tax=Sphingobium sp. B11D3B TaxID=2940575 RepID=UPI0022271170|nr:hypothetical protein [Sphingobium sp. B11D3B]MCW2388563.1 hypothetical protein [Sphingobium sp. B11D3B]